MSVLDFMKNLQTPIPKIFLSLFGIGFIPFAPGTWGSLVSTFILYGFALLMPLHSFMNILQFCALFGFIYWISFVYIKQFKEKETIDHSWIVIDEFLGMMIAMIPLFIFSGHSFSWGIGFLFFRIFDIWKPLGIRKIDQQKTIHSVLLDDIVAGLYAGILLLIVLPFL